MNRMVRNKKSAIDSKFQNKYTCKFPLPSYPLVSFAFLLHSKRVIKEKTRTNTDAKEEKLRIRVIRQLCAAIAQRCKNIQRVIKGNICRRRYETLDKKNLLIEK